MGRGRPGDLCVCLKVQVGGHRTCVLVTGEGNDSSALAHVATHENKGTSGACPVCPTLQELEPLTVQTRLERRGALCRVSFFPLLSPPLTHPLETIIILSVSKNFTTLSTMYQWNYMVSILL